MSVVRLYEAVSCVEFLNEEKSMCSLILNHNNIPEDTLREKSNTHNIHTAYYGEPYTVTMFHSTYRTVLYKTETVIHTAYYGEPYTITMSHST